MARQATLSRNPDVVFRSIEGGGVLLNVKSGAYHEVNSTAREIWEALEVPSTRAQLLEHMITRFGNVPDLDSDLDEFLEQLMERGLIDVSAEPPDQR